MARTRITIDVDEASKRAFLAAANLAGQSPQELFEQLVAENFPDDLKRAQKAIAKEPKGKNDQD